MEILQRPKWWKPGLPLPHLYAGKTYKGSGALNSGGKVDVTINPVRFETLEEWKARNG